MKEIDIYSYYAFGYNYNIWKSGFQNHQNGDAADSLDDYLTKISELELQVTSQIVDDLLEIASDLREMDPLGKVPTEVVQRIRKIINDADKTLDAELQLKKVLIVTPKRFNQEMLLKSPHKLLAKEAWSTMTENAKRDFFGGTQCIAMNLSTAAAFHLMRCIEELVKQLYFCFIKQKRMKKPMWGPMIEALKTKHRPKPTIELLEHLDMIRKNYRNPTQHPEKFYSIDEAQDLLNSSIVAINMVTKAIAERQCA